MPKKLTKQVSDFIDFGLANRPRSLYQSEFFKIIDYIDSMSLRDYKILISDPYWNNYPEYVCSRQGRDSNKRSLGLIISGINHHVVNYIPEKFKLLKKYGVGIFLKHCMSLCSVIDQQKLSSRAIKSRDSRVRKSAVDHLKRADLKKHMNDPNSSIAWSIRQRMLKEKVDIHLLDDDRYRYHQKMVISSLNLSVEDIKVRIDKILEKPSLYWTEKEMIASLLRKLSPIDVAFYLNLSDDPEMSDEISRTIKYMIKA